MFFASRTFFTVLFLFTISRSVLANEQYIEVNNYYFTPAVTKLCTPGFSERAGFVLKTEMNANSRDFSMRPTPGVSAELEICMRQYLRGYTWAPSRFALEAVFNTAYAQKVWLWSPGFGVRYQFPITYDLDWGLYWRYNFSSPVNIEHRYEQHHTFMFGLLMEHRLIGNNLFWTSRIGLGRDAYNRTKTDHLVVEATIGLGTRIPRVFKK